MFATTTQIEIVHSPRKMNGKNVIHLFQKISRIFQKRTVWGNILQGWCIKLFFYLVFKGIEKPYGILKRLIYIYIYIYILFLIIIIQFITSVIP